MENSARENNYPEIIEKIDYENILEKRKVRFLSLCSEEEKKIYAEEIVRESSPITKLLEESAYIEMVMRQRINDSILGCLVVFASGSDLDAIGAGVGVSRTVTGSDTEEDEDYRRRIIKNYESSSIAGPASAYESNAISVDAGIHAVHAYSPSPAVVRVIVKMKEGARERGDDVVKKVREKFEVGEIIPCGDRFYVDQAKEVKFYLRVKLYMPRGADNEGVVSGVESRLRKYFVEKDIIGRDVWISKIHSIAINGRAKKSDVEVSLDGLNYSGADIEIKDDEVAVLGEVDIREEFLNE